MPIISFELTRRQQQQGSSGGDSSSNGTSTTLPSYVWILVVLFLSMALTCCICARKTHRRQFLHRQAVLNSQRPNLSSGRNPHAPPWTVFGPFGRVSGDTAGLQPPPRARRRGSQASVTSLPVYMENPGVQEVVLLQRTGPKETEDAPAQPVRQPTTGTDASNAQPTGIVTTSQPIMNTPPTLLPASGTALDNATQTPTDSHQIATPDRSPSLPPAFSSRSPTLPRPMDAQPSPQS